MKTASNLIRGFLMGAADIVPGVSGGTIALVLGIYGRLVASIRAGSSALGHLIRGDWPGARSWLARVEWGFLVPLGGGILLAVITLSHFIEELLHDYPEEMAGLFTGLIAGSVIVTWSMVRRWDATTMTTMILVAVAMFALLGLREGTSDETVSQVTDPALWAFFVAGAIAICAMILPGVSGSFLLVILGMYGPVLSAVNDRSYSSLLVLLAGVTVGLALFSQVLSWALEHHHDPVVAALIGLMAGSIRVLWPWPDGLDSTALAGPGDDALSVTVLVVVALILVVVLGRLGKVGVEQPEPVEVRPERT